MLAIANKYGEAAARTVAEFQMTGSGWVMSERLKKWLGVEGGGIDTLICVLEVHPAFQPAEYHHLSIKKTGTHTAELQITDCAALHESPAQNLGWYSLLPLAKTAGLKGIIQGIDPRASLAAGNSPLHWHITIDENAEVAPEPLPVQIAKGTVLYQTQLEDHISLLQI